MQMVVVVVVVVMLVVCVVWGVWCVCVCVIQTRSATCRPNKPKNVSLAIGFYFPQSHGAAEFGSIP